MTFPLTNIKFHSPSAIIGTPSDPSSRFEYPFPSPQLEYEPRNTVFNPPTPQRQSHVHPKHQVREVPVPPTLEKRIGIELRFPRPNQVEAQASIKREGDAEDVVKKG